eukprot:3264234-Rhodomonas_salina.1
MVCFLVERVGIGGLGRTTCGECLGQPESGWQEREIRLRRKTPASAHGCHDGERSDRTWGSGADTGCVRL